MNKIPSLSVSRYANLTTRTPGRSRRDRYGRFRVPYAATPARRTDSSGRLTVVDSERLVISFLLYQERTVPST